MRALLILLALLLALPAAALELLPTTLQLPAQGGSAELWLHNPGPGRWQGQVQVLAWDQQLDAERLHPSDQIRVSPARLDLAPGSTQRIWLLPAIRQRRPLNRPIGSYWHRRCRGCRAIRCRCSAAQRGQHCRPGCWAASRPTGLWPYCDSAMPVPCTAACTICASSRRTARQRC